MRDIDPIELGAQPGTVVSEEVGYMIGTRNEMAKNFLTPEAVPLVTHYVVYLAEGPGTGAPLP